MIAKSNKRRKHGPAVSRRARKNQRRARKNQPDVNVDKILERVTERALQEQLVWLRRPQVHTAAFEDLPRGAVESPEIAAERARKSEELANRLDWSNERLALFKQLIVAYRNDPSVENYIRIRHEIPEVEIQVGLFGGIEALFKLEKEFERQGIDPQLVAGSLDADEPSIDALCLRLLELLAARGKLPKGGPGYIEKRRNAISDPTINYLVVEMLEALDRHGEAIRIPASLVVLIREQLCGSNPDLYQTYLSKERFQNAALAAGQYYHQTNKQISVRKFAAIAGVGKGTAARWLADEEFQSWFELGKKIAASENFVRFKEMGLRAGP